MQLTEGCIDCLLSRVDYECRLATADEGLIRSAVMQCSHLLDRIRFDAEPAPVIASRVHRLACSIIADPDPYRRLKQEDTRVAMRVAASMEDGFTSFRDRVLASIIANTLDYGAKAHTVTADFLTFFADEFQKGLTLDHTDAILDHARRVVYLTDNCGEIVFDSYVIEHLKEQGASVTVAVKGAPILNDATLADARALGLDGLSDSLTTTSGTTAELGLNWTLIPPDLADALESSTCIIAKGMANYESLSDSRDLPPVAYLMSVKCEPIARSVGAPVGSRVALLRE